VAALIRLPVFGLRATLMIQVPKRFARLVLGISGLFGMRTPPEPETIAQTVPAPDHTGSAGPQDRDSSGWDVAPNVRVELPREVPYSQARQKARWKEPPV
jgi:hypothetical protein